MYIQIAYKSKLLDKKYFMEQGKKLKSYLKSIGWSQKEILEKSTFSKGKLYNLFKLSKIPEADREIIITDFGLESDFFNFVTDPGKNFQQLYYDLLEKHTSVLAELNECRSEQLKLIAKNTTFSAPDKGVIYKQQLKKTNK